MQNGPSRTGQPGNYRGNPVAREAQRRNVQGAYASRPQQNVQRPAQQTAQRRPMTRYEYETMLRRRKRQNLISIGAVAAVLVAVIIAVVLILKPDKPDIDKVAQTFSEVSDPIQDPVTTPAPGVDASADPTMQPTPTPLVPAVTPEPAGAARQTGSLRSVRMRVVGDVMVTLDQIKYAIAADYSFDPQFELIRDVLGNADYTMANLETTVGKYGDMDYSGYPLFNAPTQILDSLQTCGIDMLTLANNHMLDRWFDGMKNTVKNVEKWGFDHVGAYRTKKERSTPIIKEIGGIKFGFVAYTHTTNTQETVSDKAAKEYGVPYLYEANIAKEVKAVRKAGAEVIIAFPHWGEEYVRTPDKTQKKYAKILAEAGVDIILGSHSHTVQPMGYQEVELSDGTKKKVFIIFSLGNFISTHTKDYTNSGVVIDFIVNEQADGTFTCDDVKYIPTYSWIHDKTVQVVPSSQYLDNAPAGMDDETHAEMIKTYNDIVEVLGTEFGVLAS